MMNVTQLWRRCDALVDAAELLDGAVLDRGLTDDGPRKGSIELVFVKLSSPQWIAGSFLLCDTCKISLESPLSAREKQGS